MEFGGARNRNDPRSLSQDPGQCELRRRRMLARRDGAEHIDQRLVGLARFRRKARHIIAEVRAVKRGVLVDFPGQKTSAERAERNEADTQLLKRWKYFRFRFPP